MISSKFFIINQGMELGDKTPISPLMGAKPSSVSLFFFFHISFSYKIFFKYREIFFFMAEVMGK